MTETASGTLVLKDSAGNYFLVPREVVEQGRVPTEQHAELERQLTEAAGDVQGHMIALYEGDPGNKSRPQQIGSTGGNGSILEMISGAFFTGIVVLQGAAFGGRDPLGGR